MRRLHALRALAHAQKQCLLFAVAAVVGSLLLILAPAATGAGPMLGTQSLGSNSDYNPAGWAEAFASVAQASGTVDTLSVYVDGSSTAPTLVAGLYADSGGAP